MEYISLISLLTVIFLKFNSTIIIENKHFSIFNCAIYNDRPIVSTLKGFDFLQNYIILLPF